MFNPSYRGCVMSERNLPNKGDVVYHDSYGPLDPLAAYRNPRDRGTAYIVDDIQHSNVPPNIYVLRMYDPRRYCVETNSLIDTSTYRYCVHSLDYHYNEEDAYWKFYIEPQLLSSCDLCGHEGACKEGV